jgi:hypothetical protein
MEKADETTNDPGKDLSIQGDVEMNNTTLLEGSSVILGEQDIVLDGDDQTSNSEEVEQNDDDDGGYGDNSEVENDSSDSSVKLTWKRVKKNQTKKFRIADVEDDDDRSDNSHFSQSSIKKNKRKKNQKKAIRSKAKIWQCWCSILVSWYFHHFSTS